MGMVRGENDTAIVKHVCLLLFLMTNSGSFHLYHGENKLLVNEMMMRSVSYWANTLSWNLYCASSLKQQFADRHVAQHGHIILIPSQPVLVLSP